MTGLPHNWETERGLLGGLLLNAADYLAEVRTILTPEQFHRPSHAKLYALICTLADGGTVPDLLTVMDWLDATGTHADVQGIAYVVALPQACASVDNLPAYARRVRMHYDRRDAITAIRAAEERLLNDPDCDPVAVLTDAQVRIDANVTAKGAWRAYSTLIPDRLREIHHRITEGILPGVSTGIADLDRMGFVLEPGCLYLLPARPAMGKSMLEAQIARNLARRGIAVGRFSLEMAAEKVAEREIVAESRVDNGHVRSGQVDAETEWRQLMAGADRVAALPVYVDDTPALSIGEIRSRARALQRQDPRLGMITLDYIQLATAGNAGKAGREERLSEISKGCKVLAKELGIPVVALAQLSRACETRENKRPMPSDIRECVAGDQRVFDPTTGLSRPISEIVQGGVPVPVAALGEAWTVIHAVTSDAWEVGERETVTVRMDSGRELVCTPGHRLRTLSGWKTVAEVVVGERIATPRVLRSSVTTDAVTSDEARLLGYLISDGSYIEHRSCSYVKADPVVVDDVRAIALSRFGIEARQKKSGSGPAIEISLSQRPMGPNQNPLLQWLKALGIHGQRSEDKRVPAEVFQSTDARIAEFVGALWAGDGCVVRRGCGGWTLKFASTSRGLLHDLQHLLLRLGILSTIGRPGRNSKSTVDIATLTIADQDQVLAFASAIPIRGVKGERLAMAANHVGQKPANHKKDRLPLEVTAMVNARRGSAGLSHAGMGYRCQGKEMCRRDLAGVAAVLGDADLLALAESDVLWDRVASITPAGVRVVYDLTVPGPASFVVGDIITHNSGQLEQDADGILAIYRDEVYTGDACACPGEAELIILKSRDGKLGTVKMRFRGEFYSFDEVDMRHGEPPPRRGQAPAAGYDGDPGWGQ